jgi:diguanylate cyclase (GGDEF)-like protein
MSFKLLRALRSRDIVTGDDIFRISSLLLYVTLQLYIALAGFAQHLKLSAGSIYALILLFFLFTLSLLRYFAPNVPLMQHWMRCNSGCAAVELLAAVLIVVVLTLQRAMPTPPLPWLIALVGVFPLAIEGGIALGSLLLIAGIGLGLNVDLGMHLTDWLPNTLVTLFVGLLAIQLSTALNINISAVWRADANQRRFKEYEMQLEHQSLHDTLTGLPNRRYALAKIGDAISHTSGTSAGTSGNLVMLFCDLDFFKSVNDMHGHDFGDKCLIELTKRIVAQLPASDFVARFGGNEFIVLTNCSLLEAKQKAEMLLHAVSQQLMIDNTIIKIQTSIGIAELKESHKNPSELIGNADAAMFQAKERGRNRAEIFDASLQNTTTKRAQMDVALRFALERNELALVYQPKVSLLDGSVKGFELLLRWNSPEYGIISPDEFIPIAETSGMVLPIGLWVMEQACKQLAIWQMKYPAAKQMAIAVNVSMRQLRQSSFLAEVTRIVTDTGILAHSLELEITETSAMANPLQTIETLTMLKKLGLRLALDDFGTGYSSLAYLQKLPIDALKIDKTFVRGLGQHLGDTEIVRLILALAHTLNLDTIAEGVETQEHIAELQALGCYLGQGYIFSPPVSAEEAEELIRTPWCFLAVNHTFRHDAAA